jgi:hypothetical protein
MQPREPWRVIEVVVPGRDAHLGGATRQLREQDRGMGGEWVVKREARGIRLGMWVPLVSTYRKGG